MGLVRRLGLAGILAGSVGLSGCGPAIIAYSIHEGQRKVAQSNIEAARIMRGADPKVTEFEEYLKTKTPEKIYRAVKEIKLNSRRIAYEVEGDLILYDQAVVFLPNNRDYWVALPYEKLSVKADTFLLGGNYVDINSPEYGFMRITTFQDREATDLANDLRVRIK